jgi:hypothetical protein
MRFCVSRARENVGRSRRFFTNCYFFQQILGRFPRDFGASTNSGKPQCRFTRRIRGFLDRLIADQNLGRPKNPHSSRCGILLHSREERQDAAATSPCEVNDSISQYFAVLPEVAIRQWLTVSAAHFFGHQISKIALFLVNCATRTPRWLMACTWPSRQVDAASYRIRGYSGRMPLLLLDGIGSADFRPNG